MTEAPAEFDSDKLIDYLKLTAATVDRAGVQLSGIGPNASPNATALTVEAAICHLTTAYQLLQNVIGVHCPHCAACMGHYTDGRAVTSHLRFGDGSEFVHNWHADPQHSWNRPREVATHTTSNGTRKRIVIAAPGHLDSVTVTERSERPT
jgi:hypothetical protein